MPTRYLDPKVDLAFKRVFGEHEHLLRSFLNALLPLPDDGQIESLEYLTPKQVPELPGLYKNSIVAVQRPARTHLHRGDANAVEHQL